MCDEPGNFGHIEDFVHKESRWWALGVAMLLALCFVDG